MNVETDLRTQIKAELQKVTQANSPYVWRMIQTKDGYKSMENLIIEKIISFGVTPAAAIPQIEVENQVE